MEEFIAVVLLFCLVKHNNVKVVKQKNPYLEGMSN